MKVVISKRLELFLPRRIGLLASLLTLVAMCASCAAPKRVGIDAEDDELLRTLSELAREGTRALCDPRVLEERLAIRIGSLNSYSSPNVIASEQTESIAAVNRDIAISRARYWKFRSASRSTCSLEVRFRDPRLCNTDSSKVQRVVGAKVEFGPPIPGGTVYGHGYTFTPRSGSSSSLALGRSNEACASGFQLSAEGAWK